MKHCSTCGNEIIAGAAFCGSCGTPQENKPSSCSKCGKEIEENEKFCAECGTSINAVVTKNNQIPQKEQVQKSTPRPVSKRKTAPSTKKKKGGVLRTIGKIVLGFISFVIVGSIILYNLDDDWEDTAVEQEEIIDYPNDTNENSTEIEEILDTNDKNIADKYRDGVGVEANQYKAFELYKKLADKGDLNAMVQLSDYYEQGIWTKKDTKKAKQLLQQASNAGSLAAKWQLEFLENEK